MAAKMGGIDWASEIHALCVDEQGARVRERMVDHSEAGIAALCRELVAPGVERVAIERPDGILVDRLPETGITVIAVHPDQAEAAREHYSVARGKSDRLDAFVLTELARTDAHRLRAIRPDGDETKAPKALTRTREDLVGVRVEPADQLRAQLDAFWPGALVVSDVDSPISLAFLARYPGPADAKGLGPRRMECFLARHRHCGRRSPEELLERMHSAPTGRAGELEAEARRGAVPGLVAALRPIVAEIAELTSQIRGALAAHPDAAVFRPLFRDAKTAICPATLIAELGDSRERYPTDAALAADAGMSPVALESGRRRSATFRRACDKRLRVAVATLADSTRHWHPWAEEVYGRARAKGQDHPHAIRTLGRAWVRVLWRCRQDRAPYDTARHGNFNRLGTAGGRHRTSHACSPLLSAPHSTSRSSSASTAATPYPSHSHSRPKPESARRWSSRSPNSSSSRSRIDATRTPRKQPEPRCSRPVRDVYVEPQTGQNSEPPVDRGAPPSSDRFRGRRRETVPGILSSLQDRARPIGRPHARGVRGVLALRRDTLTPPGAPRSRPPSLHLG